MKLRGKRMEVDGPSEEVFDFMADILNETHWNPELKSVRRLDSGPLGVGSEWEGVYKGMGAMRIRLEDYERPHRLGFSTSGPRMDMDFRFAFAPDPDRADITADADITPKGVMKLMAPLLGVMMRRTMARRPEQVSQGFRAWRTAQV